MKLPRSYYNWTSFIGSLIVVIALLLIVVLFVISTIFDQGSSYLGLFIYMALPALMIVGLILIPIGMLVNLKKNATEEGYKKRKKPTIDLNDKRHQNAFVIFIISSLVFLFLTSIGSYEAFHYTESVKFCGTLCHKVMDPEYVTYQHSAHANVPCVECHVGAGASWYVKSKVSGLYQVYAALFDKYPRPIESPVQDLRPARETCEKCHWPEKFYARKLRVQKNFLSDENNTEWDIVMQMKTGPLYSALGLKEGSHWHINPEVKIEYIASNNSRESIPWVRFTNLKTGEITLYLDEENPLEDSLLAVLPVRTMDCIDCHNRPSHAYKSPPDYIDNALISGAIPKDIPQIKYIAMDALKDPFTNKDTAMMYIDSVVTSFYQSDYPAYYTENRERIAQAVAGIQESFNLNAFPFMKVNYTAYPDHIGHLETNGCFRCHSDLHATDDGKTISKDCDLCHTIIAQGVPGDMMSTSVFDTLEFQHPVPLGNDIWKVFFCSECHSNLYQ
ncbi:MAG: NapC/NirT family cytochrome c [Bacteroidia bacterium]|nr:NapC/NirT family cytochrome c [Bacteroidia bacterium]